MIASVSSAARDSRFCSTASRREQERQVAGGAEAPFAGDLDEVDAALGVESAAARGGSPATSAPSGSRAGEVVGRQRLGRGEEQRLDHAQALPALLRRLVLGGGVIVDGDHDGGVGVSHCRPPGCDDGATVDAVADIERREGLGLAELELPFADQFEAGAEGARRDACARISGEADRATGRRRAASSRRSGR